MLQRRNLLPPLDYFVAFESAATQESFAAASRDLNISETAISRKIKLLELHFKCPLFIRSHRSITLTPEGHQLLGSVRPALEQMIAASDDIFTLESQNTVTLSATNSVASLWLMPRLQKFNRRNNQIKINLVASDNDAECLGKNVDVAILRGNGTWPDHHAEMLFGECVFPVCSPAYRKIHPDFDSLEAVAEHSLIEVSSEHKEWLNWQTWLQKKLGHSMNLKQTVTVNTYPLAIQAALDGIGVCLGWEHLVDHLLKSGQLVQPFAPEEISTRSGYYLVTSKTRTSFPARNTVEKWLLGFKSVTTHN